MNTRDVEKAIMTPQVKDLVSTYLLAEVYARAIRAEVDPIHAQILQDIEVHANTYGRTERITKMGDLYMTDDNQLCATIYAEADRRLKAAGIKPADMELDFCPALTAENDASQLRARIIEVTTKAIGVGEIWNMDARGKWISLIVGAVTHAPDFVNPLNKLVTSCK